ncbi:N-terminal EF-hand calcium-binding protein 1, partial [Nibea albiflora]
DDGKLSFDEFKAYFSDGVLTAEELKELFHTIDTHNTEGQKVYANREDVRRSLCVSERAHLVSFKTPQDLVFLRFMVNKVDKSVTHVWTGVVFVSESLCVSERAHLVSFRGLDEPVHLSSMVNKADKSITSFWIGGFFVSVVNAPPVGLSMKIAVSSSRKLQQPGKMQSNVDTDELCEYFSQHLGEYENVLAALEDLNMSILKAMDKTKKGPLKPEVLSIQWSGRRSNRRLQRNSSLSPNNPLLSLINSGVYDEDSQWMIQVNRLQKLIDRLEQKICFLGFIFLDLSIFFLLITLQEIRLEPVEEEVLESKSHILIVQRQLSVLEEELEEFRLALRQYMECACAQTGCLHIAVQRLANESRFILYEFWEHNNVWKNHLQTNYSKTFQRGNVDFLETPESITTMLVPGKNIHYNT